MNHIDQIIFEKLTVEEQEKVTGGEIIDPLRPTASCDPIIPPGN